MSASLISSLRALSLRPQTASRVLPTICPRLPTARTISLNALASTRPQRPVIQSAAAKLSVTLAQQQTRGMKVHSAVKKRCEHCKVSQLCLNQHRAAQYNIRSGINPT
ncbi:hypothetical protein F5B22DRAFT_499799 [Xylaria bambusicola]|uniref:uncharacterized protein n=1 Tax=Xylaria bambusicola TaxID=326684 RepID=UPI0020075D74|nr:uncharacterized protein F5B22DRAFT_499799 [Xylaria bambusicola]KAI0505710.1 hypothetical protein F5B22DRAFT_499799 [Xylaria bambusicola]